MRNAVRIGLVMVAGAALAACGTTTPRYSAAPRPDAAKRSYTNSAGQKVGKPYQIGGVWYVPREQPDYDEKGIASWYGPGFHMKATATGETFDMDAVSAAHTTLPLPSMVEVTNLDNGRKLVVRVNDRGPFVDNRIIDLSREAARQLGYEREGIARVRVRYLGPPDLLGPKDGLRYAKNDLKPKLKFSLKPTFPITPPAPASPAVAAAAPTVLASTAAILPKAADVLTPTLTSAPSVTPVVAPPAPISVASLPPPVASPPSLPATSPQAAIAAPPVTLQPAVSVAAPATELAAPELGTPRVEVSPPSPGLRVQAGAFASKANAERAVSQLAQAGLATIEPMTRADGVTLYRVVLSAPNDEAAAFALRDRVEQIGFTDAQVVRLF